MLVVALSTLLAGILALGAATLAGTAHASRATEPSSYPKPTIVLVHGAFADSSGWNAVAGKLMHDGYEVIAFSNPLRNPQADGEYLRQSSPP